MTGSASDDEVRAYVEIGSFLFAQGISVPEIIAADYEQRLVAMEDVGDMSLYRRVHRSVSRREVLELYKTVLAFLGRMQMIVTPRLEASPLPENRTFGYQAFRAETDYFRTRFIEEWCGIRDACDGQLEQELHLLASLLDREPRGFMHRDFQSQNIYLKEGCVRIIDFQTATRGLPQYDLAALLKDAYVVLNGPEREDLLQWYLNFLSSSGQPVSDREHFAITFQRTGLQRNMQALGAFAFLSMHKGKTEFQQHIPAALHYLCEALALFPEFHALRKLVGRAMSAAAQRVAGPSFQ